LQHGWLHPIDTVKHQHLRSLHLAGVSQGVDRPHAARQEFRPVAVHAALLYFLIAEFSVVNCMYQARTMVSLLQHKSQGLIS